MEQNEIDAIGKTLAERAEAQPLSYPEGLFPLIRDLLKGRRDVCWYGFEDGIRNALFADWGDERALNR